MTVSTTRGKLIKKIIYVVISAVFWTALWDFLSYKVGQELLLPSPAATVTRLLELIKTKPFWEAAGVSLSNTLGGYLMGAAVGTVLAVITAAIRPVDILFSPINVIARATPVASFIILALVWIENVNVPSFIAFLMVTPIVWNALKTAILKVSPPLKEMAKCYCIPWHRRIFHLYVPAVIPQYVTALVTSMGLSWKAGIAAEVLCRADGSIGDMIYESKLYLETADLFAYTATVIVLSLIIEIIFTSSVRRFIKED
jgi:NitT/TauT family transport system permease protein